MGITMIATGAFRETGTSFFFIPKGALTHHRAAGPAVVLLLRISRALCEADCALFGERQAMPPSLRASVVIACAAVRGLFARFAALPQTVVLCRDNLPSACENLPQHKARPSGAAALSQLWTMHPQHRPFSFVPTKETKPPLAGGRKEVNDYGDLSSGSEGREPWYRPFRLCGFRLSELFLHLQRL